jgi:hypothetical protein
MVTTPSLSPSCPRARRRPLLFLANLVIYKGYHVAAFIPLISVAYTHRLPFFSISPFLPVPSSIARRFKFFPFCPLLIPRRLSSYKIDPYYIISYRHIVL